MKFFLISILFIFGAACNKESDINSKFLESRLGNNPEVIDLRANDLTFSLTPNSSLNQTLSFTSSDTSPVSFQIVNNVSNGTLALNDISSGLFQYTPNPNWTGQDSFTYRITQKGNTSNVATITLNVATINSSPTISSIVNNSTSEDSPKGISFVIDDAESALTCSSAHLSLSSSDTSVVPVANVVWSGSAPNCEATITPTLNAFGASTLTFTVSDGSLSAHTSFTLTVTAVNDLPTLSPLADINIVHTFPNTPIPFSVDEGGGIWEDSQTLTVTAVSSNQALLPDSGISINFTDNGPASADLLTPTITLIPVVNHTGQTTVTVTVTDSEGGQTTRSFSVTVTGAGSSPTLISISPPYARQAQTITLTGNMFSPGMSVNVAGGACGSVNVINSTTATCSLSVRAKPILADVKVTTSNGEATLDQQFLHLGNPRLWYRADAISGLSDGQTVSSWIDQSTSAFNATNSTANQRPIYKTSMVNNLPAVFFDGSNDRLTLSSNYVYSSSGGISTVAVLNSLSNRIVPFFINFGAGGNDHYGFFYDIDTVGLATAAAHGGIDLRSAHTLGANEPFVVYTGEIIFNTLQRARLNGTEITTTNITLAKLTSTEIAESSGSAGSSGPFTLGMQSKQNDNANRNLHGNIAEVLLYTEGTLTSAERKLLECYMSNKYAIDLSYSCSAQ